MSMSAFFGIDGELETKKALIQREIIEKNYNSLQFLDYCSTRRPGGDDLQNWSISELEGVVKDFLRIHEDSEKTQLYSQQNIKIQPPISVNDKSKIVFEQIVPISCTKEIDCKKLEPNDLNFKEIKVEVRNPKANSTSILKSNYISYEVVTSAKNWVVTRRFSDFFWLRETLKKFFPRLYIPPMASKKMGNRRFEEDFVIKRMNFLNKFLNDTLRNEIFKSSEPIIAFLSLDDRSQFEFKMKELSSYNPSFALEDVRTLDGKIKLLEEPGMERFNKNINQYFTYQNQLIKDLSYNMKNFYMNIGAACTNLEAIQNDFETLSLLNSKVLLKEDIVKNYNELAIFIKNWRRVLFNQNEIFHKHIRAFYKYVKCEGVSFMELVNSWDQIKKNFDTENNKLIAKKEKLWAQMDTTKWEIAEDILSIDRILLYRDKIYAFSKMCTNETKHVQKLLDQLNYANWLNNEEFKTLIDRQTTDILMNTKNFTEELYPTITNMLDVWGNLDSFLQKE